MARSLKKPPFVHYKLQNRVDEAQESGKKNVIKRLGVLTMVALKHCVLRGSFSEKFDTMS